MKNVIKNKCYLIKKDGRPYGYINVKKDFYAEGILIDDKSILSGYFYLYDELKTFILSKDINKLGQKISAMAVIPTNKNKDINFSGNINYDIVYQMFDVEMDEYCFMSNKQEIESKIEIKLINDDQTIKDINYLIRTGIKDMNETCKYYYNYLKQHRYGNLKEMIKDLKIYSVEENIDLENVISDLKIYLDSLTPKRENEQPFNQSKKKIRRRKK